MAENKINKLNNNLLINLINMENSEAPGTEGPPGFGYAGDSAGGQRGGVDAGRDTQYRAVAREINQGILDGHNTQLGHPPAVERIQLGGAGAGFGGASNGKRLSPTRSKYIHRFYLL